VTFKPVQVTMTPPAPSGALHADPLQLAWVVTLQLPPPNGDVEGPPLITMADALVTTPNTANKANLPTTFI
jgi:hypothetical protein